jgi:hypothetical protein
MAGREEEERRGEERLERDAAAAGGAKRKRLVGVIGAVVLVAAVVAGVALALAGGGSPDEKLRAAAKDGGCVYRAFPEEGRDHTTRRLALANFKTNPPTSGDHHPEPAQDGAYPPGTEPPIAKWVHTLEHGRVLFQYRPDAEVETVEELEKLYNEEVGESGLGYHSVLMRNNSKMSYEVAAVAWRHYMVCERFKKKPTIAALKMFREERVDKAPEKVP